MWVIEFNLKKDQIAKHETKCLGCQIQVHVSSGNLIISYYKDKIVKMKLSLSNLNVSKIVKKLESEQKKKIIL